MTRNQTPVFPSLALRLLLLPLAPLYAIVARLRPLFYRWGVLKTHRVATPVISVGNLSVGGSGKTPMVEYLAREAARAGLRPAVATRGYGRRGRSTLLRVRLAEGAPADARRMGDEPFLLATRNPDLPLFLGPDRVAAARLAEAADAPDVILLDDGYQHLRLARDLNVLLVDAERGLGNGLLLPLGMLREPASALARADAILITKANLGDAAALTAALKKRLARRVGPRTPVFTCDYRPARLVRLDGKAELPPTALAGRRVSLVCAIAQPAGFVRTVEALGAELETVRALRDHAPYDEAELARLESSLAGAWRGVDSGKLPPGDPPPGGPPWGNSSPGDPPPGPWWITTEKDGVKLRARLQNPELLWVLEMEVAPEPAAAAFFFDFLSGLKLK